MLLKYHNSRKEAQRGAKRRKEAQRPMISQINIIFIRKKMAEQDLNQKQLAEALKVDPILVSEWFLEKKNPSWPNIVKIAKALDLEIEDILLNYDMLSTFANDTHTKVLSWIEQIENEADDDKVERIIKASNLLLNYIGKIGINNFYSIQYKINEEKIKEDQDKQNIMPRMSKEEALDL